MVCRACNIDKDLDLMVKHRTDRICKECNKKYRKSEYSYKTRPWSTKAEHKTCRKCNMEYHIDNFHKHKGGKYGVDSICKSCSTLNNTEYEKRTKHYLKRYKNNIDKYRKKSVEYDKIRSQNDTNYKLRKIIRVRIWELLKKSNSAKSKSTIKYLGCSIEQYKQHLESQFKPEMNWGNHGVVWEVDHIIPLSKFDLTLENNICVAFHYTNTQPLFKTTEIAESFGYNETGNRNKLNKIITNG